MRGSDERTVKNFRTTSFRSYLGVSRPIDWSPRPLSKSGLGGFCAVTVTTHLHLGGVLISPTVLLGMPKKIRGRDGLNPYAYITGALLDGPPIVGQ